MSEKDKMLAGELYDAKFRISNDRRYWDSSTFNLNKEELWQQQTH